MEKTFTVEKLDELKFRIIAFDTDLNYCNKVLDTVVYDYHIKEIVKILEDLGYKQLTEIHQEGT